MTLNTNDVDSWGRTIGLLVPIIHGILSVRDEDRLFFISVKSMIESCGGRGNQIALFIEARGKGPGDVSHAEDCISAGRLCPRVLECYINSIDLAQAVAGCNQS
jgi:hypothetical protein